MQLIRPSDPVYFENLITQLFNIESHTLDFEKYGKTGQDQGGVDIVSWKTKIAIQCALKDIGGNKKTIIRKLETKFQDDLSDCINTYPNKFDTFYFTSTFDDDSKLQNYAFELGETFGLNAQYWGWQTISRKIFENVELFKKTHPGLFIDYNVKNYIILDKKYHSVPNYIQRKIKPSYNDEKNITQTLDAIKEYKKVMLLGIPGMGKSNELQHLANKYSIESPLVILPILCKLNLYKGDLEELIANEYILWNQISIDDILFLFDGQDEIPIAFQEHFISDIKIFLNNYPNIRILISCRSNFGGTLSEFKEFVIQPISADDINNFIKKWEKPHQEKFLFLCNRNNLLDLLENPFYLDKLVFIFQENNFESLPESRAEILKIFFEGRLVSDHRRSMGVGQKLDDNSYYLTRSIQTIALTAETLERNFLTEEEFQQIEPDYSIRALLKHSFLFNKIPGTDKWKFDHNNYQEYLAAMILSKQSIEIIFKYLLHPESNRIKPSFSNTITFIISILGNGSPEKFQKFISKIIDIDSSFLISSEYHKIDLSTRKETFRGIFNSSKVQCRWIINSNFTLKNLAKFSGGGFELAEVVLKEIIQPTNFYSYLQSIILIGEFEDIHSIKPRIASVLIELLNREDKNNVKYEILNALCKLGIKIPEFSNEYIKDMGFAVSSGIRYGIYNYILCHTLSEDYLDVIKQGLIITLNHSGISTSRHAYEDEETSEPHYGEESLLEECIGQIRKKDKLHDLLSLFATSDQSWYSFRLKDGYWKKIINNCIEVYREDKTIAIKLFDAICNLLHHTVDKLIYEFLKRFIEQTDSSEYLFGHYLKESVDDWYKYHDILELCITHNNIQYMYRLYEDGNLTSHQILASREALRLPNPIEHNLFLQRLITDHGEKYAYQTQVNWQENKKLGEIEDLRLLNDQPAFIEELISSFKSLNRESVSNSEICKFYKTDGSYRGIIFDTLLQFSEPHNLSLSKLLALQDPENWNVFKIKQFYKRHVQNKISEFDEVSLKCVIEWCIENIKNRDFKSSIVRKDNGYYFDNNCLYIMHFYSHLDIQIEERFMVDMIWYNSLCHKTSDQIDDAKESKLISKLIDKIGIEAVTSYVAKSLECNIENSRIYMDMWRICKRQKISIAEKIPHYLFLETTTSEMKFELIEIFEVLDGDFRLLENALPQVLSNKYWIWELAEFLMKKGSVRAKYILIGIIRSTIDQGLKLRSAKLLIENNNIEGLEFIYDWTKDNKSCPLEYCPSVDSLIRLISERKVEILKSFFLLGFQKNYRERIFPNFVAIITEAILEIGKVDEELFQNFSNFFNEMIANHNNETQKSIGQLFNVLDALYHRHYSFNKVNLVLAEVIEMNRLLK